MSAARDGTNLTITPLTDNNTKLLLGETTLKVRFKVGMEGAPFDEMYQQLLSKKTNNIPQLSEFFDIQEEVSDAKLYFDAFIQGQESLLLALMSFLNLQADTIIVKNIDLEAVGSLTSGDYNKVKVGDRTFYIEIEKPVDYYDSGALRLGEERDYKEEYNRYHGKPEQIKRRQSRNGARAKLEKEGRVSPGDGKDVDHKDHNALNNSDKNLRVRNKSSNRGDNKVSVKEEHGAGEEGTDELLLRYLKDTPYTTIPLHLVKKGKSNATGKRKRK